MESCDPVMLAWSFSGRKRPCTNEGDNVDDSSPSVGTLDLSGATLSTYFGNELAGDALHDIRTNDDRGRTLPNLEGSLC